MKLSRILLLAVAIIIVVVSPTYSTETVEFDGVWWNSLDDTQKLAAVQGMIDTYEPAFLFGVVAEQDGIAKAISTSTTLTYSEKLKVLKIVKASPYDGTTPSFGRTFGAYMHGIDDFYANHPDRMKVHPAFMIDCLADDPQRTCDSVGVVK